MLLEKLELVKSRFSDVEKELSNADAMSDMKRFAQLNREYKELQRIVEKYHDLQNVLSNLDHSKDVLRNEKDEEFKDMARKELEELENRKVALEEEIKVLLIPADPEDEKNAIMEIRAGTGGDEASIFAGDLYRMYTKFCERNNLRIDLMDFTEGTAGGFKEVIF